MLVDNAHEVEERGDPKSRIEVVVHCCQKIIAEGSCIVSGYRHSGSACTAVAQRQRVKSRTSDPPATRKESLKSLHCTRALAERFFAEVNRTAVVSGEQQHADGFRSVSLEEVFKRFGAG